MPVSHQNSGDHYWQREIQMKRSHAMRNETLSALLQYSDVAGSVQYVTGDYNDNTIIIQRGDKTD